MCFRETPLKSLNVQPAASSFEVPRSRVGRAPATDEAEESCDGSEAQDDAEHRDADSRPSSPRRASSFDAACALFRRLDAGLVGHAAGEGSSAPVQPRLRKRRRPPTGLPCVGSMVIVALLIGLAVGAFAVLRRRPPGSRRAPHGAIQEVIELERALAAAEAELAVERGSRRRAARGRDQDSSRPRRSTRTARASSSSPRRISPATCGRSRTRSSAWTSSSRASSASGRRRTARSRGRAQVRTDHASRARRATSSTRSRTPHVRGRWGEIQLRRVIEMAGMVEHCDFVEQQSTTTPTRNVAPTRRRRPHLPGGKQVVVDAKVPLVAYLDAFRRRDRRRARDAFLADHARQVREHVQKLAARRRTGASSSRRPSSSSCSSRTRAFLRAALEHDPSLSELAWRANVILASPTHADRPAAGDALRLAAGDGRRERARGARELGRELYKRIATMGAHFVEARTIARRRRRRVQRDGRLARAPGARPGAAGSSSTASPASSRRSSSRSSARRGRSRPPSSSSRASRRRSRPSRPAPTPRERGNIDRCRCVSPDDAPLMLGLPSVSRRLRERRS